MNNSCSTDTRNGTWAGGWPHLDEVERRLLGSRIGTLQWQRIVEEWNGTLSRSWIASRVEPPVTESSLTVTTSQVVQQIRSKRDSLRQGSCG